MTHDVRLRTALISVSDKTELTAFVRVLADSNIDLMSTGGTYKLLQDEGLAVTEVSQYTGFPEMMDGRVKTLHPKVHGGLLGRRDGEGKGIDADVMAAHGIKGIDLVVVNLYPFEQAIATDPGNLASAIENIDIGGPAMLRSAAKNFDSVAVVVDRADYDAVAEEIQQSGGMISHETRFRLAVKAFEHVARYDAAIANYLSAFDPETNTLKEYPGSVTMQFRRKQTMRYGENPHQSAAFYTEYEPLGASISTAEQLQGKELSFNNVADTDAALSCVQSFDAPACVIVKHANPCGVAEGVDVTEAYRRAFSTDPTSAFGGIIAFNRDIDEALAAEIIDQQFVEVVIAPAISDGAREVFSRKKNVRVLAAPLSNEPGSDMRDFKRVSGGLLIQGRDDASLDEAQLKIVTRRAPTESEREDLLFAWKVAKFVKSNAIVYARDRMTIGVGAGQMSRVYSAKIAGIKAADAGLDVKGSVMASDAFFPFRDGIDAAAEAGIQAVIQPGGSIRDEEVIAAADEAGIAMIFTGIRHFRH